MIREPNNQWLKLNSSEGPVTVDITTVRIVKPRSNTIGSVLHCKIGNDHVPIFVVEDSTLIRAELSTWQAELNALGVELKGST